MIMNGQDEVRRKTDKGWEHKHGVIDWHPMNKRHTVESITREE
jgi:hypothetical protein